MMLLEAEPSPKVYDVVVVGGGAVGLGSTYEVAKAGKSVLVLEQNNFYNQAGSSGDLPRMYRTMYAGHKSKASLKPRSRAIGILKTSWLIWQRTR